ncbi:MAG TPA: cytochrome c maturation protein CcmE [Actinomycetota bacterium]|nr:cytochrome c maturation protein CcmE [Actinomycetota bacterium]
MTGPQQAAPTPAAGPDPAASNARSARARRLRWTAGIALILAGVGSLAAWSIASPGAVSYFVTPSDLQSKPEPGSRSLRLGGRVAGGSLDRSGSSVAFVVTDGRHSVPVRYHGEVPDTLKESTDVVADGRLDASGTLVASRIMAKCSSKFVPEEEREARAKVRAAGG